jgi:transcriptional regulator with XRE-family HTH domain
MEQLRTWRMRRFQSQQALAERAGVRTTTVQRLEQGTEWPWPTTVGKLCAALEVSLDQLLTADELAAATRPRAGLPRPVREAAAASAGAQDLEAPPLCAYCPQPLDPTADAWHLAPVGDDPAAPPRVAHLECWLAQSPRPPIAPCCRKGGACGQLWR